jgi:glyoxylase-like metal-dependent hydrolase (beta-lactamase superfamily II)
MDPHPRWVVLTHPHTDHAGACTTPWLALRSPKSSSPAVERGKRSRAGDANPYVTSTHPSVAGFALAVPFA